MVRFFFAQKTDKGVITTVEINLVSSSSVFHSKWQKSQKEKSPCSLSLSDRSTADVVECADVDYATGSSFCSSCSIPLHMARGLWSSGSAEKDVLCAITMRIGRVDLGSL